MSNKLLSSRKVRPYFDRSKHIPIRIDNLQNGAIPEC